MAKRLLNSMTIIGMGMFPLPELPPDAVTYLDLPLHARIMLKGLTTEDGYKRYLSKNERSDAAWILDLIGQISTRYEAAEHMLIKTQMNH